MAKKKTKKTALKIESHILVPKHSKLNKEDTKSLFDEYKISSQQLPKIKKSDPAIAQMNIEVGDIIKIIRKSQTSGETIFYRSVTE